MASAERLFWCSLCRRYCCDRCQCCPTVSKDASSDVIQAVSALARVADGFEFYSNPPCYTSLRVASPPTPKSSAPLSIPLVVRIHPPSQPNSSSVINSNPSRAMDDVSRGVKRKSPDSSFVQRMEAALKVVSRPELPDISSVVRGESIGIPETTMVCNIENQCIVPTPPSTRPKCSLVHHPLHPLHYDKHLRPSHMPNLAPGIVTNHRLSSDHTPKQASDFENDDVDHTRKEEEVSNGISRNQVLSNSIDDHEIRQDSKDPSVHENILSVHAAKNHKKSCLSLSDCQNFEDFHTSPVAARSPQPATVGGLEIGKISPKNRIDPDNSLQSNDVIQLEISSLCASQLNSNQKSRLNIVSKRPRPQPAKAENHPSNLASKEPLDSSPRKLSNTKSHRTPSTLPTANHNVTMLHNSQMSRLPLVPERDLLSRAGIKSFNPRENAPPLSVPGNATCRVGVGTELNPDLLSTLGIAVTRSPRDPSLNELRSRCNRIPHSVSRCQNGNSVLSASPRSKHTLIGSEFCEDRNMNEQSLLTKRTKEKSRPLRFDVDTKRGNLVTENNAECQNRVLFYGPGGERSLKTGCPPFVGGQGLRAETRHKLDLNNYPRQPEPCEDFTREKVFSVEKQVSSLKLRVSPRVSDCQNESRSGKGVECLPGTRKVTELKKSAQDMNDAIDHNFIPHEGPFHQGQRKANGNTTVSGPNNSSDSHVRKGVDIEHNQSLDSTEPRSREVKVNHIETSRDREKSCGSENIFKQQFDMESLGFRENSLGSEGMAGDDYKGSKGIREMILCLAQDGGTQEDMDAILDITSRLGGEIVPNFELIKPECVVTWIGTDKQLNWGSAKIIGAARAACVPVVDVDWILQSYWSGFWLDIKWFASLIGGQAEKTPLFKNVLVFLSRSAGSMSPITNDLTSALRAAGAEINHGEVCDVEYGNAITLRVRIVENLSGDCINRSYNDAQFRWLERGESVNNHIGLLETNEEWAWESMARGRLLGVPACEDGAVPESKL